MQLIARELNREHVQRFGVHDGLKDRSADIADRKSVESVRAQDRLEHLHRRRLAVGARDSEPWNRIVSPQAPRRPPGRCHDQVKAFRRHVSRAHAEAYVGTEDLKQFGLFPERGAFCLIDGDDGGSEMREGVGCSEPADAEPGDEGPYAFPRRLPTQ